MSISCAPRNAVESGEMLSIARCQVAGFPPTVKLPGVGSGRTWPLGCRARCDSSAAGQGVHLPAWRTQSCNYLSTCKILNKNGYISWHAAQLWRDCPSPFLLHNAPQKSPADPTPSGALYLPIPGHLAHVQNGFTLRPQASLTFLPSPLDLWAVGPSALPCAGAAPPQRPPPKSLLIDRSS